MKKLIPILAVAALTLTACGSSEPADPNDDKHINGMDGIMAALLCQKQVASRAGIERKDMVDVDNDAYRKVRVGDDYHWYYQASDAKVPGGGYACNVYPEDSKTAQIEVIGS